MVARRRRSTSRSVQQPGKEPTSDKRRRQGHGRLENDAQLERVVNLGLNSSVSIALDTHLGLAQATTTASICRSRFSPTTSSKPRAEMDPAVASATTERKARRTSC